MKRKDTLSISNDKELTLIYSVDKEETKVYLNKNESLLFKSNSPLLNYEFKTSDYAEATATLMRIRGVFMDNKFWDIKIKNKYDINIERILYWLTGGDREWLNNKNYKYKWDEVKSIFINEYIDKIMEITKNSRKLKDVRDGFMSHMSLPIIYEFALKNKLI